VCCLLFLHNNIKYTLTIIIISSSSSSCNKKKTFKQSPSIPKQSKASLLLSSLFWFLFLVRLYNNRGRDINVQANFDIFLCYIFLYIMYDNLAVIYSFHMNVTKSLHCLIISVCFSYILVVSIIISHR